MPAPLRLSLSSPLLFAFDEADLGFRKGVLMIESIKDPIHEGDEEGAGGVGLAGVTGVTGADVIGVGELDKLDKVGEVGEVVAVGVFEGSVRL